MGGEKQSQGVDKKIKKLPKWRRHLEKKRIKNRKIKEKIERKKWGLEEIGKRKIEE